MKKFISTLLSILLLQMSIAPAFSQSTRIKINQNLDLRNDLPKTSVKNHLALPVWTIPPPEPPYHPSNDDPPKPIPPKPRPTPHHEIIHTESSGGSRGMGVAMAGVGVSAAVLVGGGLLAFFLTRGGPYYLPTKTGSINPPVNTSTASGIYNFNVGEEVQYNLVFKNSPKTPIYKDTIAYIQIPDWIDYVPQTIFVDNARLTDAADNDIATYFKDDKMIVLKVGDLDTQKGIMISFITKVLTATVTKEEAFCRVKFQSVANNYDSDWKKLSIDPEMQLPPFLKSVVETK
jgi:hypothetical protein